MLTRKIALKNHLIIAGPLVPIIIGTIAMLYIGIESGNEKFQEFTIYFAVIFFGIQFWPQLVIHIQHYFCSRNLAFEVNDNVDRITVIRDDRSTKYRTDDIESIDIRLPISVYNGGWRGFIADNYFYGKLKFKDEDEPIIVTTLLDEDLAVLKLLAPEKTSFKREFYCMI